jgi:hypothetical protein
LEAPVLQAAIDALPGGSVSSVSRVALPPAAGERSGSVLHTVWNAGTVTVILTTGDPSAVTAGQAGPNASGSKDGLTVVVIANGQAASHLTRDDLDAVVNAVLGALQ